jgi:hypothetical protein
VNKCSALAAMNYHVGWLEDIQSAPYVGGLVEYLDLWDILSDHILISIKLDYKNLTIWILTQTSDRGSRRMHIVSVAAAGYSQKCCKWRFNLSLKFMLPQLWALCVGPKISHNCSQLWAVCSLLDNEAGSLMRIKGIYAPYFSTTLIQKSACTSCQNPDMASLDLW